MARRSPPKQKWRPLPESTTARTALLRAQVMAAASRSIAICRLSALPLSGRFNVTSATAPRVSTCTAFAAIALLVRRDPDAQTRELRSEFQLAGKPRVLGRMGQLRDQLALVRHHGWQPRLPRGIDIDVTGGARAHAATDGGHAIVELTQVFHHLQARATVHLMLDAVAIHHPQE